MFQLGLILWLLFGDRATYNTLIIVTLVQLVPLRVLRAASVFVALEKEVPVITDEDLQV